MTAADSPTPGVDFDHYSDVVRGPQFWDAIAELQRHGPLVWVENYGGYWAATGYQAVREIAQDWRTFSSAKGATIGRPSEEAQPYVMPIEIDPPRQKHFRIQVNPFLTPASITSLEGAIRKVADDLIDGFIERGSCDYATEFARVLPGTVFFRLLAEVGDDTLERVEPLARALSFDPDVNKRAEAARLMREWAETVLHGPIEQQSPIVQAVRNLEHTGEGIADHELFSGLQLLAQGGIGTTANLIGAVGVVLSGRPELQERIRHDVDGLVPALMEETLRMEPPVTMMFRTATKDTEVAGRQIKEGQWVGLFFGGANRDPGVFDRATEFDIDRPNNPHLAFGLGVHRCIGSNLARTQARIAIEQTMKRVSPFRIPEGAPVEYVSSFSRGPASVPLTFTPGERVDTPTASSNGVAS